MLGHGRDSAGRPGPCRKSPSLLYVESGEERIRARSYRCAHSLDDRQVRPGVRGSRVQPRRIDEEYVGTSSGRLAQPRVEVGAAVAGEHRARRVEALLDQDVAGPDTSGRAGYWAAFVGRVPRTDR